MEGLKQWWTCRLTTVSSRNVDSSDAFPLLPGALSVSSHSVAPPATLFGEVHSGELNALPGKLRPWEAVGPLGSCGELVGHLGVFLSVSLEDITTGSSCLFCACNPCFLNSACVGIPEGRGSASL